MKRRQFVRNRLASDLRVTVHLHYYQGLTLQETAAALEIATSTVKHRLRRAVNQIREELGESNRSASRRVIPRVI